MFGRRSIEAIGIIVGLALVASLVPGCKLIFEPPEDAVDRLFKACYAREVRTIDELIEDEELRAEVRKLQPILNSELYRKKTGYWSVVEVEEDDETGLTYAYVIVEIPNRDSKSRRAPQEVELVFEMERSMLRWTIHYIENLDIFIKKATIAGR